MKPESLKDKKCYCKHCQICLVKKRKQVEWLKERIKIELVIDEFYINKKNVLRIIDQAFPDLKEKK